MSSAKIRLGNKNEIPDFFFIIHKPVFGDILFLMGEC
jgi:hypothetical protein